MENSQQREKAIQRLERELRLGGGRWTSFRIAKHPDRSLLGLSLSEVARRRQLSEAQSLFGPGFWRVLCSPGSTCPKRT